MPRAWPRGVDAYPEPLLSLPECVCAEAGVQELLPGGLNQTDRQLLLGWWLGAESGPAKPAWAWAVMDGPPVDAETWGPGNGHRAVGEAGGLDPFTCHGQVMKEPSV